MTTDAPLAILQSEAASTEEAQWVRAACRGEEAAILQLLSRYRPPLVRLLTGVTGDPGAGEDLAQEAFLRAFRRLEQLRDPARFYPWLRCLAVRLALRRPRERAVSASEQLEREPGVDCIGQAETRLAVHAVLARLPADLRAALVLRELEGLDYVEIAETLGVPVGTVRSRLFTARERFRALWGETEGTDR